MSPLLRLTGASDVTIVYAIPYFSIYLAGSFFVMVNIGLNSFISIQGRPGIAMITTLIGAVINIVLDPIFIFSFKMGVAGAAIATVISQAVSALWILHFLTSDKATLRIMRKFMKPDILLIKSMAALGLSPFIMAITESLIGFVLNGSLSHYGDIYISALTIMQSALQFINVPLTGFSQGCIPVISYNYGAKNNDRVKKAFFTQFKVCVIFTCISWAIMMLAPQLFAGIFTSDKVLANYTAWALRIYMAGIFAMGFQVSCQQSFMALGQAKVSLILACLRKLILLIPLIFILPLIFQDKVFAVFLAEPVSDIIAAIVTTIVFMFKFNNILSENE